MMNAPRLALALLALFMVGATAEPRPELIVQWVHPMQRWTSAAEAPLYATVNTVGRIEFWDARTGTLLRAMAMPPAKPAPQTTAAPPSVVLSNDGRRAAFAADGRMALIVTRDGTQAALPANVSAFSRPVAFSPDGKVLAVNIRSAPDPNTLQSANGSIALIAVADGATVPVPGAETTAAYSPDGRYVATLAHDRDRLLIFDVRRRTLRSISDGGGVYGPLAYSADGSLVASLGDDPSIPPDGKGIFAPNATDHQLFVKLWDVRRGRRAALLPWQPVSDRLTLDEQAPGAFAFGERRTLGIAEETRTVVYDTASLAVRKRLAHTKLDVFAFGNQAITPYRVGGMLGFLDQKNRIRLQALDRRLERDRRRGAFSRDARQNSDRSRRTNARHRSFVVQQVRTGSTRRRLWSGVGIAALDGNSGAAAISAAD
jgi:hypothetical protein